MKSKLIYIQILFLIVAYVIQQLDQKLISGDWKGILTGPSNITITGMNKLLQRLPDRNREEVSNQAIVLVQQLTVQNEEMKKTVVFNEVFIT